jgi:hypothetical protein
MHLHYKIEKSKSKTTTTYYAAHCAYDCTDSAVRACVNHRRDRGIRTDREKTFKNLPVGIVKIVRVR